MTRFLTTTAVAMLLGMSPALAQSPDTTDMQQQPPAMNAPSQPSAMPADPGAEADRHHAWPVLGDDHAREFVGCDEAERARQGHGSVPQRAAAR